MKVPSQCPARNLRTRPAPHPASRRLASYPSAALAFGLAVYTVIAGHPSPSPAAQHPSVEELGRLSLEELSEVEITSVFKRPEPLSRAPAAVYVITQEDIRRSGAVSLPEVLRLAPNLHVARLDAANYTISARGFNTFQASNKLLVLIDGRSIYTPLHGGVYWDQQQVMLEDIQRIEVVSGPGGTLWGANAVNGVINIITRSAWETQGGLGTVQFGTDRQGAARYGGKLGENGAWRAYALGLARDEAVLANGTGAGDDWRGWTTGFRSDWNLGLSAVTLQGDLFENYLTNDGTVSGGNILGRWTRRLGNRSALELQAYYDSADREVPGVTDKLETFDLEAQHSFPLGDRHDIVWGGGYRATRDEFVNTLNPFVLRPERDTVQLGNVFLQDTISLGESLTLTLGSKLEYSSYTGFEYLPNARVAWQVGDDAMLWAAVSQAVRTPSRIDRDLTAPGLVDPATDLDSEKLIAYELGYRGEPFENASVSVSLYYNDYDELRALSISPDTGRLRFGNVLHGETYGLEAWGDFQVRDWWRLSAGVNVLQQDLELRPPGVPLALPQHVGNDPEYQLTLRSHVDITRAVEFDVGVRVLDDLPQPSLPGYVAVDARVAWYVTEDLELSLAAFNIFDEHHPEGGTPGTLREIPRSAYFGARWKF